MELIMNDNVSIWKAHVRDYEIDFQGIVHNSVYLQYLDNARALFLEKTGLNVRKYAETGINIMLISAELSYKKPLQYPDYFCIKTTFSKLTRFKILCDQIIYLE